MPQISPGQVEGRAGKWRVACLHFALRWLDQRPIHFALIALLSVGLSVGLRSALPQDAEYFDNLPLDTYYFRNRHVTDPRDVANKLPHTKDIILVETSYLMPRPLQAKLLRQFRKAKVVAFDFMFVDQEAELSEEEKPLFSEEVASWRRETEPLAQAMRQNGNVILGTWQEQDRRSGEQITVEGESEKIKARAALQEVWQHPAPMLWNAAHDHAHLHVEPGVTRHVDLFEATPERTPALGLAIVAAYLGVSPQELRKLQVENGDLQLGQHRVPVGHEWMRIDYVGGREAFESPENHAFYTSILDFHQEEADEYFEGKIIIIGESSRKSKEILETPAGPMPGMQIHANIAATLLSTRGAAVELPIGQIVLFSLAMCLLLIAPLLRWPLLASFFAALGLIATTFVLSQWIYSQTHQVLPFSLPLLAIGLTYNATALYEYRRARETLGRFIGQEMVAPTLSLFSRIHLGGHVEEASAFFCDLRGYTALSEKLSPEETTRLITEYTSTLVRVVKRHGGRPIDYQGDGVFVLFEPALAGAEYSRRAILAALELYSELKQLQEKWKAEGIDAGKAAVGIGIETGSMMIGLIGAEEHLKPGAIGDAVNVAARVQQLNVTCCTPILLTHTTRKRAGESFCDDIGVVLCGIYPIRGRETPIEIYGVRSPWNSSLQEYQAS